MFLAYFINNLELIILINTYGQKKNFYTQYSVFRLLYPIGNNCGSDLTVKLNKCMRNVPGVNHSLGLWKVRNSPEKIISVGQGTPPVILAK